MSGFEQSGAAGGEYTVVRGWSVSSTQEERGWAHIRMALALLGEPNCESPSDDQARRFAPDIIADLLSVTSALGIPRTDVLAQSEEFVQRR